MSAGNGPLSRPRHSLVELHDVCDMSTMNLAVGIERSMFACPSRPPAALQVRPHGGVLKCEIAYSCDDARQRITVPTKYTQS